MVNKPTIEVSQGKANISLGETQGNAFVFQLFGKLLQLFCGKILLNGKN